MEAGDRRMLNDCSGKPLYSWDSFDRRLQTMYDAARRPTDVVLTDGGAPQVVSRTTYGETQPNPETSNLRTKAVEVFDQAGMVLTNLFDFKGNTLRVQRETAQVYDATLDWSVVVALSGTPFLTRTSYDALNRTVQLITPDNSTVTRTYNEANLLNRVEVNLRGVLTTFISNVDYNAKSQRTRIEYGNSVTTRYTYDPLTFRLVQLETSRDAIAFPGDCPQPPLAGWPGCQVQDLSYTYDPMGNITNIRDTAQQILYFQNRRVEPTTTYLYDATYRLIEATGREHLGQVGNAPIPHSYNDVPRIGILLSASDGNAMGSYLERYFYDSVGNIEQMRHVGTNPANPGWTRIFDYQEASLLEPAKVSNRLTRNTIGADVETYSVAGTGYDAQGNMLRMPHLQAMQWDFLGQLQMTRRQAVNGADADGIAKAGEQTWYVYDSTGERVRKVTERDGVVVKERIYVGAFEVFQDNGPNPLVRETLHISDGEHRFALVETRTDLLAAQPLIRYQLDNHVGSASVEVDQLAQIISYEEYTPFGSTSFQAVRNQVEAAKRYRFTGMERDEENGATYHKARYYLPWLGRWSSADPKGLIDGPNLYRYARDNPIKLNDPDGTDPPDENPRLFRLRPYSAHLVDGSFRFTPSTDGPLPMPVFSGTGRYTFGFESPPLGLSTTGFADVSASGFFDASSGQTFAGFRGGVLLGDPSGLNLVATGEGNLRIPARPESIPSSFTSALAGSDPSQIGGDVRLRGSVGFGTFGLGEFSVSGSQEPGGLFQGNFTVTGGVPGVRLDASGTGTGNLATGVDVRASADLHILGLQSLHINATGTIGPTEASLGGTFSGPGPLYTSYITGDFNLSTRTGISAQAGVFGVTYTPGVDITDPNPPSPGLRAVAGDPAEPWAPSGLTLGASWFRYSQGNFQSISGGYMPDFSNLSNPRFGITARLAF